jgi:hypothetical protein
VIQGNVFKATDELVLKRDLLELHAMNAGVGRPQQRRSCEDESALHLDGL